MGTIRDYIFIWLGLGYVPMQPEHRFIDVQTGRVCLATHGTTVLAHHERGQTHWRLGHDGLG
jgi:hypothetical protein